MKQDKIRNVAIIAHVDHGKTTLVDQLFQQSGMFRENQEVKERLMDSMDLERERGITIKSKNGACKYKDHQINIIDTPGHADFGGEVERVLKMADGAVFLVDAAEGPMPQSYFVLKKAVALNLPVIVVVNKIDKPDARCDWVVDQVFDLLAQLEAPDEIMDFPVIYASAKQGLAKKVLEDDKTDMNDLFDSIIENTPEPSGDPAAPLQFLATSISYSPFMGRLAIGKITQGTIKVNQDVAVAIPGEVLRTGRITKIFGFEADQQVEVQSASTGDIVAVAGIEDITIGQTITSKDDPKAMEGVEIDPPTVAMTFMTNTSPFSGKEGEFVTSSQIKDRLYKELLTDVAMTIEDHGEGVGYKVSGRGELHLSIFIEKLRREGFEFQVSKPTVIFREVEGEKEEPYERLTIEVNEDYMGKVIERLGERKGQCIEMNQEKGMSKLIYKIPTRGLLGYQSEFMTDTKGMGIMNYVFDSYGPFIGDIRTRKNGVLISKETAKTIAFSLVSIQERGRLFLGPGEEVYTGQIIGEHSRDDDLVVNASKGKKLTNMRASGTDENVVLTPYTKLSLEQCLSFINDHELVECTPKNIRLRKKQLSESDRKRQR
ncbi:translational GTPase TypA [Candidatus Marinamargulisbacteria bacterium SCGC AAA071-K20]|nr:translational GTPase TypA [Candidatus Marinamargulisbacteria bacterium SCGC AAA071-K20]